MISPKGVAAKIRANIKAIRILKKLDEEQREPADRVAGCSRGGIDYTRPSRKCRWDKRLRSFGGQKSAS